MGFCAKSQDILGVLIVKMTEGKLLGLQLIHSDCCVADCLAISIIHYEYFDKLFSLEYFEKIDIPLKYHVSDCICITHV